MCPTAIDLDALTLTYNSVEVALWGGCGVAVFVRTRKGGGDFRRLGWISGVAFLLFAVSDLVEIRTGAWWRPWPLLLMKAACVCILLWCLLSYKKLKKRGSDASNHS